MQKESIVTGISGLIMGLVIGLAIPKLFATHTPAPVPGGGETTSNQMPMQSSPAVPDISQFKQVIEQMEAELKANPKNIQALTHLGGIYYNMGRLEEAQGYFKQILEFDPKNIEALTDLGNINYDSEQFKPAAEYYQKVLEQKPELTDVRVDMATMYRRLGQADKAIEELKFAIEKNPNHPNARTNLGIILYYDKNDPKTAVTVWEEYLQKFPNHEQAANVKQMIEKAKARI